MVSNLLSPYLSTLAIHAQSDSGGCGKLIILGFINAEDNKATEQKTEQTAPACSQGLVHHPKMEASSYTLTSVFDPPTDSNSGPAGPIAVNAPPAEIRGFGTSSKDTSTVDHSSRRESVRRRGHRQAQDAEAREVRRRGNQGQGQGQQVQADAFVSTPPSGTTLQL
jgi:hypothetical protein